MSLNRFLLTIPLSVAMLATGAQPWKEKPISEWTEEDTRQVLTDSPWAKTVHPDIDASTNQQRNRQHGPGGGIGLGGIGLGLPGGMGRRGGMGYPGGGYPGGGPGGYPGGGYPGGSGGGNVPTDAPTLTLRWESALPVREAALKGHETATPSIDDAYYGIAVYGVPDRMINTDSKSLGDQLKKQALLRIDDKKHIKAARVEVLRRDDGPVFVYLFPRSNEISKNDKRIAFEAKIVRLKFEQSFYPEDMSYRGKLEL